jgi:tRNA pseudouridine32 synthase/23S rRNA pseudouridine746 synthase
MERPSLSHESLARILMQSGRSDRPQVVHSQGAMTVDRLEGRLLYRDGLMLIVDKPAGLPVHKGPKGGPSVEELAEALRFGLPQRPELAHRLDKDTSGCLVLGRHRKALRRLGRLFADGRIAKTYWAIVEGAPPEDEGRIELPLGKRSKTRGWWMKVDPGGLPSITDYRVLGRAESLTFVELRPLTGRTHQLRVHLAAIGCPILGDAIYGDAAVGGSGPPLHLHARAISVPLYVNREAIMVMAPPPSHMLDALRACKPSEGNGRRTPR